MKYSNIEPRNKNFLCIIWHDAFVLSPNRATPAKSQPMGDF